MMPEFNSVGFLRNSSLRKRTQIWKSLRTVTFTKHFSVWCIFNLIEGKLVFVCSVISLVTLAFYLQ